MRKNKRKNHLGYSFLEVFITLSILGVLLSLIFAFPVKVVKQVNSAQQQQDCLLMLYEKISPLIWRSLRISLNENKLTLILCKDSDYQETRELNLLFTHKRKKGQQGFVCCLPKGVHTKWYYWHKDKTWESLLMNTEYTHIKFLKVSFLDANNTLLDQFVFSCYAMQGNDEE